MVLCQVNKIFRNQNFLKQIFRCAHSEHQSSKILYPLESRRLLKVHGNDASVFLQGLITNDMRHFEEGAKSMYAMFLNNKGRVMYDTLIYKWGDENTFMLECDKNVLSLIQKHLKLYKLKRQVEIHEVNPDFRLWALISHSTQEITDIKSNINIFKDPRLLDLGYRVLSSTPLEVSEIIKAIGMDIEIKENEEGYKYLRYKLGVSEGVEDLPPASTFPLEVNCDYLHGVSFHKGCYIGQELTARVHHTGVVRKRIMPLKFTEEIKENLQKDTVITASNNPKSNLGKLKGFIRDYGLGLIRIKEALDANLLNIGNYSAVAVKPNWWPVEAPKEKINVLKTE